MADSRCSKCGGLLLPDGLYEGELSCSSCGLRVFPTPNAALEEGVCEDCQGSFPRREGPARLNQKTCEPCRALRHRRYRLARQDYRPGGREPVRKNCERCGESFWCKPFGARVRTLCDQCLRKHVNISVSRPRAEPIQPVQLRPDHLEQLPTRVCSGGLRSG